MPGGPHHVRAQDRPFVERLLYIGILEPLAAQRERPLRARIVLRLHGAQPPDHVSRLRKRRLREALVVQSPVRDFGAVHSSDYNAGIRIWRTDLYIAARGGCK